MQQPIKLPLPDNRIDWLKSRQIGIGGSEVAAILGLSKWSTPLDVYEHKTCEIVDDHDSASMEWGRRLEPVIRQKYADTTGFNVIQPGCMFQHPEHKFMIANVDGIREDGRILEIKTARSGSDWGEEGTDEIPDYYKTQVQHYMTVVGAKTCDIAVLIGASDFRIYTIESDPELEQLLIEAESEFWNEHVVPHNPPAPQSLAELQATFPLSKSQAVEATDEVMDAALKLVAIQDQLKQLSEQEKELKAKVQGAMKDCDTLAYKGQTVATWKSSKPVARLDSADLKAKMPDIYNQFLKVGNPIRRFTLKI